MNQEALMQLLHEPRITEKATMLADSQRQFVFKVDRLANKRSVKKAVELMFDVKVESVNIINMKGKQKIFGRMPGRRSDWKKAYVKLKHGFDIDYSGGA